MCAAEKVKPNWKKWDEVLIDAWGRDIHMYELAIQFLSGLGALESGVPEGKEIQEMFVAQGITSRGPKAYGHLCGHVRPFFYNFFPKVNDLLWAGKREDALKALRKYKTTGDGTWRDKGEVAKIKKEFARTKTSDMLPIIPGTNAMHVQDARRTVGDWGTVKASGARHRHR